MKYWDRLGVGNLKAFFYYMRRNFCQACSFARDGVKTRIAIPHTCAGAGRPEPVKHQYIPKREELEKYLARLKELMELDDFTGTRNPE